MAERDLASMSLRDEGIIVLGIERVDGNYSGVPRGETVIQPGDVLVLYSRADAIADLERRGAGQSGDAAHEAAVREQADLLSSEEVE